MSRTVIIDGDVLVYKVAEAVADTFELSTEEDDEFIYRNIGWANKEEARRTVEKMIDDICKCCKSDSLVICLSDMSGNFRKQVNPEYKANRKNIKPILYNWLRAYLKETGYKIYEKPSLKYGEFTITSLTIFAIFNSLGSLVKRVAPLPIRSGSPTLSIFTT